MYIIYTYVIVGVLFEIDACFGMLARLILYFFNTLQADYSESRNPPKLPIDFPCVYAAHTAYYKYVYSITRLIYAT